MAQIHIPTIEDLQGRWRLVRVGRKGGHAPFFVPWLIKVYWEFDGNRYIKISRGSEIERGRVKLKAAENHALINELIEEGSDAGEKHLGIIRMVGRKLEQLQSEVGDPRPEGFPYTKTTKANHAIFKPV